MPDQPPIPVIHEAAPLSSHNPALVYPAVF